MLETVFQFEEDLAFNCPEILGRGFSDQLPRINGKSWQTQWWLRLQLNFCCIPHLNFCVQRKQLMIICNIWRSNLIIRLHNFIALCNFLVLCHAQTSSHCRFFIFPLSMKTWHRWPSVIVNNMLNQCFMMLSTNF